MQSGQAVPVQGDPEALVAAVRPVLPLVDPDVHTGPQQSVREAEPAESGPGHQYLHVRSPVRRCRLRPSSGSSLPQAAGRVSVRSVAGTA